MRPGQAAVLLVLAACHHERPSKEGWAEGHAYLLLGPPSGVGVLVDADSTIAFDSTSYHGPWAAGRSVAPAGDVNGDGLADLFISDHDLGSGGYACVVNGPVPTDVDLATEADFTVHGVAADASLGYWISPAGDLDADGLDDVLVTQSPWANEVSRVLVYAGPLPSTATPVDADAWLDTDASGDASRKPSGAGDVDGDGDDDLLLDADAATVSSGGSGGAVYIMAGPLSDEFDLSLAIGKLEGDALLL